MSPEETSELRELLIVLRRAIGMLYKYLESVEKRYTGASQDTPAPR